jgi:hypothetical protein
MKQSEIAAAVSISAFCLIAGGIYLYNRNSGEEDPEEEIREVSEQMLKQVGFDTSILEDINTQKRFVLKNGKTCCIYNVPNANYPNTKNLKNLIDNPGIIISDLTQLYLLSIDPDDNSLSVGIIKETRLFVKCRINNSDDFSEQNKYWVVFASKIVEEEPDVYFKKTDGGKRRRNSQTGKHNRSRRR